MSIKEKLLKEKLDNTKIRDYYQGRWTSPVKELTEAGIENNIINALMNYNILGDTPLTGDNDVAQNYEYHLNKMAAELLKEYGFEPSEAILEKIREVEY